METRNAPDLLEALRSDWTEHARTMDEALAALIRECKEALGEPLDDTGERRREFRDSL